MIVTSWTADTAPTKAWAREWLCNPALEREFGFLFLPNGDVELYQGEGTSIGMKGVDLCDAWFMHNHPSWTKEDAFTDELMEHLEDNPDLIRWRAFARPWVPSHADMRATVYHDALSCEVVSEGVAFAVIRPESGWDEDKIYTRFSELAEFFGDWEEVYPLTFADHGDIRYEEIVPAMKGTLWKIVMDIKEEVLGDMP